MYFTVHSLGFQSGLEAMKQTQPHCSWGYEDCDLTRESVSCSEHSMEHSLLAHSMAASTLGHSNVLFFQFSFRTSTLGWYILSVVYHFVFPRKDRNQLLKEAIIWFHGTCNEDPDYISLAHLRHVTLQPFP